jgi:predicted O-methyltransferase YrrM
MVFKQSLRKVTYKVAPRSILDGYHYLKTVHQARRLSALRNTTSSQTWLDALWSSHFFRPLQKRTEILRLLEILREFKPLAICEIGAAGGGTTFLLAQASPPDAVIVTVDLVFPEKRKAALRQFALPGQKLICLQADSHRPETMSAVKECLAGRSLDVLYLDGDHSYEGIKADFELFSTLVRPGGMIVFHDIVPDFKTRYGIETSSYVGGVPQFWKELKASHQRVEELVEDSNQDGFGIGILHWEGQDERVIE